MPRTSAARVGYARYVNDPSNHTLSVGPLSITPTRMICGVCTCATLAVMCSAVLRQESNGQNQWLADDDFANEYAIPGQCNIDRVPGTRLLEPTAKLPNAPTLYMNASGQWPAANLWTRAGLAGEHGFLRYKRVRFKVGRPTELTKEQFNLAARVTTMALPGFIKKMRVDPGQYTFDTMSPALLQDLRIPPVLGEHKEMHVWV